MTMYARLKPFNERKGFRTKIYNYEGQKFLVEKGWYPVSEALADKLKELHQDHYDEESAKLFDVGSEEEIDAIDEKEAQAIADARTSIRQPRARAGGKVRTQALPVNNAGGLAGIPGDLTTEDLYTPINGTAPVGGSGPASDEASDHNDEGRLSEIGRTSSGSGPKTRKRSDK